MTDKQLSAHDRGIRWLKAAAVPVVACIAAAVRAAVQLEEA